MISAEKFQQEIDRIIETSLREDIGDGDHSSLACIPASAAGRARLLVKDRGILAGVGLARQVFQAVDPDLDMEVLLQDGSNVGHGDTAFFISGSSQSILRAERLVLNAMQRMSAIATKTRRYVNLLEGTGTKILDTRKTTPGIRALEKWAVRIGGGTNHRFALYDMIMLKGGIREAISKTREYLASTGRDLKIIVEARNLVEVDEILACQGVHRILLDNFNYADTREAVRRIGGRCETESSGGIDEKTLRAFAECGVDYISSGALTHSVHNLDMSLKAV
mgnify:FL=1